MLFSRCIYIYTQNNEINSVGVVQIRLVIQSSPTRSICPNILNENNHLLRKNNAIPKNVEFKYSLIFLFVILTPQYLLKCDKKLE